MPDSKPNILVIWGDDIGISNLSCYSRGMMGYFTPNIDRIADEGMLFTDSYGEQSCTAGRSSFITGQSVYRTGMSKVGMPGVDIGLQKEDPTIAELLKPMGYATGQFGKNHLGDLNKYLPTVHGFDEFFGNLYHLNAEEEPEHEDYPTAEEAPLLRKALLPRGVIHSWATEEDSGEVDERYGPVGKQRIEDTGPLTKERMETVDDETTSACVDFIKRQHESGTPFFVWMNMTHMHFRTHTKPESKGQAGRWQSPYHDTMIDHDRHVGTLLDLVDELGIAEDTIVIYSTDNGPHANSWPDGATTPFRSEKATNWEGAFRIPEMIRWPGKIKPRSVSNDIVQHHDWLPTFLAAAGDPDIVDKLKAGHTAGDMTYKVHIDGYNLLPYLTGEADKSPRRGMIYFSDDGDVLGIRADNWKIVFMEQRCQGTLQLWFEPFTKLRAPKLFNLRTDPFERADVTSNSYWDWVIDRLYLMFYGSAIVNQFLETFKEFPPRQEPASFTINHAVEELEKFLASRGRVSMAELSNWADGSTKSAIVDFVGRVTAEGGPDFVAPDARVAVFDNDGTLWCEKPMYIQLDFIVRRLAEKAAADPSLASQQPYQAAVSGDLQWFGNAVTTHYQGDDTALKVLAGAVMSLHESMSVEDHAALVNAFFAEASHPTLGRPYLSCVYTPMVQLLRYLEAHDFTNYIVSGGGRDFMRPITESIYGIPPERVVGSSQGLKFDGADGHGNLLIQPALDVFDDGPEKPVRIWNRIGRRPILSAGNSNGDNEMLMYSGRPGQAALRLLVLHDDAEREFDYTAGAERALDNASTYGWSVVSLKNDWTNVFSD